MREECDNCEYNRQCFVKKNVGIFECEKETINNLSEEEIKELIEELGYKEFYRYYEEKIKFIEDLQQKVKQLEKDKSYANWYAVKKEKKVEQLENIRKEAIEYIENNWITYNDSKDFTEFNEELPVFIKEINILLNILNKGSGK